MPSIARGRRMRAGGARARPRGGRGDRARSILRAAPGSRRRVVSCSFDRLRLVRDADVDDAVGRLDVDRPDRIRLEGAESAALDHRRAAHAEGGRFGRDDEVGRAGEDGVAREAAARDDGDARHDAREAAPQCEGAGVERRDDRVVGVARAAAAALAEDHGGKAHPLDQLEQSVLLAVAGRPLGAGEHRVVVAQHGAGGALGAVEVRVDARGAADEPVGRGALDQLFCGAAHPLRCDGQRAVLDEAALVDEIGDVLARGSPAALVALGDGFGARVVAGRLLAGESPRRGRPALPPPRRSLQSILP